MMSDDECLRLPGARPHWRDRSAALSRRKRVFLAVCAAVYLGLQSVVARAQASRAPSSALGKAQSRLRGLIGKVFTQADIRDKGETDDEHSYRFEVFDEANGYARVIGPFGGYDDFFILRGENRDYLISIEYACGTDARSARPSIDLMPASLRPR